VGSRTNAARSGYTDHFLKRAHTQSPRPSQRPLANTHRPVERVEIPYGGASRPDCFTRWSPTVVARRSSSTAAATARSIGSGANGRGRAGARLPRAAVRRPPVQKSILFERDIPFCSDWEKVLTPAVEFLVERDDVDASRLALYRVKGRDRYEPIALLRMNPITCSDIHSKSTPC
jgi:hypothetical protein